MGLELNETDLFISKRVRFLRKKRSWGLKVLAAKLNISIQQLQKYETDCNKVSASLLLEICKIFEITLEDFFEGFGDHKSSVASGETNFNVLLIENNIDDEIVIREAVASFPKKLNLYSIREGYKALEYLKEISHPPINLGIKPDIVLLELHLPKVSGIDILRNIKKDRAFHYIPVVILTDNTTPHETLSLYNLQASGFIVKANSSIQFKEQIHNVLFYWSQLVRLPK